MWKPGVPKILSPHKLSVWTCVSHECVSQKNVLLWGFWSGVRSGMKTHRRGRLSKQCGHGEGHCSVFREQQVVQCTERVPLLSYISSLPQVLHFLAFSLFQRRGVLLWVGPWEAGLSEPLEHPALSFLCHFAICVVLCLLTSLLPLEKSQLQEWNRKKLNMTLCVHFHVSVGYFYIYYEPLYYTLPSKVLEWGEKEATSHRVCCLW